MLHIATTTAALLVAGWNACIVPPRSGHVKWQQMTFLSFSKNNDGALHIPQKAHKDSFKGASAYSDKARDSAAERIADNVPTAPRRLSQTASYGWHGLRATRGSRWYQRIARTHLSRAAGLVSLAMLAAITLRAAGHDRACG